jgi:succinate dehydrogenase/fumarate reductase cytochrome b subunit
MPSAASSAHEAASSAHEAADSRPVKVGVRIGLLCYGVTHLLIAWIALQVAFGGDSQKASQNGAFQELAGNTFGRIMLWIIVVGFVAVALWRLTLAIWGYGYESDEKTRLRKRAAAGGKVVVFAALAVLAATTAVGGGGGGGGQQKATAGLLGLPGGQWIVGAVGLGILVAGGSKIYAGWKEKFVSDMSLPSDQKASDVVKRTGQVGFIAKGISVGLIGILVIVAAIQFDSAKASGLDAALRGLAQQPFGPWLLALVALGLAAYGVFCAFDARYHRV